MPHFFPKSILATIAAEKKTNLVKLGVAHPLKWREMALESREQVAFL